MSERVWRIGVVGTFDVANYGDLLFPLLAEAELSDRLGAVELLAFSYHPKSPPAWPFAVQSVVELPEVAESLDAMLIGGGFVVRFDKDVAPGYEAPLGVHHPTGYWLTPALVALGHHVPVVWNAPGMHRNEIPSWSTALLELTLRASSYVAVRDEPTREALDPLAGGTVKVVPDTAFAIARLLRHPPAGDLDRLREAIGLRRPYILVQSAMSSQRFASFLDQHAARFEPLQALAVPIGPVLGDHPSVFGGSPALVPLPTWPQPVVLAQLIAGAEAVVGVSYHLAVTALACGVPVFTPGALSGGKYTALDGFDSVLPFPQDGAVDPNWFLERVGRTAPAAAAVAASHRVAEHWDRVAAVVRSGRTSTHAAVGHFWQQLPDVLEEGAALGAAVEHLTATLEEERRRAAVDAERLQQRRELRHDLKAAAEREQRLSLEQDLLVEELAAAHGRHASLLAQLAAATASDEALTVRAADAERRAGEARNIVAVATAALVARDHELTALRRSTSWRATAPFRAVTGRLRREDRRLPVLDLHRLRRAHLREDPYRWALVDGFVANRAERAVLASFPTDHYKSVQATGGEKDYSYDARPLVEMQAAEPSLAGSLDPVWRALALELASPDYRATMALLTGIDLTDAPLEVNAYNYGSDGLLGPHPDLPDKLVTHVVYFNRGWHEGDGGCLAVLRSADPLDVAARIPPSFGTSVVLIRSDASWHAVEPVTKRATTSRRSLAATFYRPGSVSSMWPPHDLPG